MGQSTDGQISYGVVFEDGYEFPWSGDSGGLEDWWRKENGFHDSIHDESGNWIGGVKPSQDAYDKYFAERRAFDETHPLPIAEVNYCSGEYPMIILAVPSSCRSASRGYPERIEGLGVVTDAEKAALREFCAKYELTPEHDEGWWLSSYWG